MPFALFRDLFPGLAEQETRSITLEQDDAGLPAGDYGFIESFCDEPGCDCRRVLFTVACSTSQSLEAVISYGWERPEFYAKWIHNDDPEIVSELKGPTLNIGSPQSEHAPAILKLAKQFLLSDERHVDRSMPRPGPRSGRHA